MRWIIRFSCFLVANMSLFAQNESAFKAGEFLKYRVRYGIFNASFATLNVKNKTYEGKNLYQVTGKGVTTGLAKLFFKVDDTYESYFDKNTQKPYFFNRDIYEGGYTKKLNFFFNDENNQVRIKNLENNENKNITIDPQTKDVISTLYYLRNNLKTNDLKENQEINLDMIFDDDEIFKFRLKFLGRERIETHFGDINTLVFRPLVQDGRVFKEQESLTLWISDDANKIPVKVKASLRVGSLVGELVDFNELKNPSELKK
ncbi:MAG: DUF3108 domain-containing protein [Capnocytophaga sp.]|nr:DUF3108 domain-containing protein [Capnocytophaga sp.]